MMAFDHSLGGPGLGAGAGAAGEGLDEAWRRGAAGWTGALLRGGCGGGTAGAEWRGGWVDGKLW